MTKRIPLQDLTIYLANPDLQHGDIVSKIKSRNYQSFDLGETRYYIYAKRILTNPPSWLQFFEGRLKEGMVWDSSAPGIVLLVEVGGRTFATTFGQGRHMLVPGSWEDQFGLKVVLNTVEKVRSLEKRSFDANFSQTKTQTSTYTDVNQFGFDFEQDILRGVTGRPIDSKRFGMKVTGADALTISISVDLAGFPRLLADLYKQSSLTKYRTSFPFVDHMRAVASPTERDELDKDLVSHLESRIDDLAKRRAKQTFAFDLVVPKIIDWGVTTNFGYGRNRKANPERQDISIDTFLEYFGSKRRILTPESLRKSVIIGLDASGIETETWSGYKCLVGESSISSKKYILSDGSWYQVDKDYLKELNAFVSTITPYPLNFPLYKGGRELKYNEGVKKVNAGFYCLDQKMVRPTTNQKIEFCDLYTENYNFRDLIHVKHGTSSAVLSHLFAQGTTSIEAYTDHAACRDQAETILKAQMRSAYAARGRPQKFRVVFAIIRSRKGSLPFFSKVNLKRAHRDLNRSQIPMLLAEVEYDPSYKVVRRK